MFWPDIVDLSESNEIWNACGLPPRRVGSLESGQVLIDKSRHWGPLQVTMHLNEDADTYYRLVYGDKDTFLIAWLLTGAASALVPHRPFQTEYGLAQRDFSGALLFQHRCWTKWSYVGDTPAEPDFRHFSDCLAALAELRSKWAGRVFAPPSRSVGAREIEAGLTGTALHLKRPGADEEEVHLLADGEIGTGRAHDRQYWYVVEDNGDFALVLHDGVRETHRLSRAEDGIWKGRRMSPSCR